MQSAITPLVEMTHVGRTFPGVTALDGVNFQLMPGEVHVLFGENGAGKSTLISILSGVYPQTSGSVKLDGEEVTFASVADAKARGISAVFQEFSLVPTLSVAKNIFLGDEPMIGPFIDRVRMEREAKELFAELDFDIDVRATAVSLSRAEQQMTEIAKAIRSKARVLILDEPTASLTERETETLFRIVMEAKARGVGIVYISHRIQEFSIIADRVTVLRDGKLIETVKIGDTTSENLVEMMTGRAIDQVYPSIARAAEPKPVLSIRSLRATGVNGVDIDVRAGEVLGVAGLVGSGKSRAFRAALGLSSVHSGEIHLNGENLTGAPTRRFLRNGVFYLPPDRKSEGLMLSATARNNINLGLLFRPEIATATGLSSRRQNALSSGIGRKVDLTEEYMARPVANLSGGNQQKALFGKGFGTDYQVYIFDEPTVGVDMGTRAALYRLIQALAEAGKAVVVISSDLPEAMNLAHRLLVFAGGRVTAELSDGDINETNVLKAFFKAEGEAA
ncbi:ATP-binding cassette domain-containing protein [Sinorhizobium meliloti]|jgi:ribose transport system ATP-binding protein|uniref:sugar ABC transporter ATP-binding protein n=1 Tax=Rhizobium meliloti TaxID=382 RepID=UPI001296C4DA|nr:sugar ABC transporter ATP-binding protein [Sinorhizobium meliloti]MDW9592415.1 ATP-binding cassette domain-containing protein [Sinorhizobium meliloti]MDX0187125.1 ATP-binding cassette domain-containing protein [Sinorhizobium meliloti]MQV10505.1 ATP-binding cassette domain-containing protein [Sinorhizobium meliloti]MQV61603.1 ATP-binding cassette domain-containing protein [Sinorhizobium meliloti]